MWSIFKVFTGLVTVLPLFYVLIFLAKSGAEESPGCSRGLPSPLTHPVSTSVTPSEQDVGPGSQALRDPAASLRTRFRVLLQFQTQ